MRGVVDSICFGEIGESSSFAAGAALRSSRGVEAPLFVCEGEGADRLNAMLQFDVAR